MAIPEERQMIFVDRAITLTQPWATLMAIGAKKFETRSRSTNYRGWVAIHAAKGFPDECRALLNGDFFADALDEAGIDRDRLPLGEVLAVVNLTDCRRTERLSIFGEPQILLSEQEEAFGNYAPGRFAYITEGVRRLRLPLAMRGFQSIPWRMPIAVTDVDLLP
jgi:activating signal cointegrator 1